MTTARMTGQELRSTMALSLIFAVRMLGLFMILPIFTLHAHALDSVTPRLIGIALGIYGLSQAILQIPFGMTSDFIGRKPVIAAGLGLFIAGSILAALSHSIYGVIAGRALQGAGAVGSTLIALLSDLTREQQRSKAIAMIGASIGVTFTIALILGPIIDIWFGLQDIFWLSALLGSGGIAILLFAVPTPPPSQQNPQVSAIPRLFSRVLRHKELLRLDISIMIAHAILTGMFVVLPIALYHHVGLDKSEQWALYLPVMVLAFLCMFPMLIMAEKKRKLKETLVLCVGMIIVSQFLLWDQHHSMVGVAVSLWIFFTAFTAIEAILPSLVSRIAPAECKGTAIGVYSTSQFFGIFVGGCLGGWMYGHGYFADAFLCFAALSIIWLAIVANMAPPQLLIDYTVHLPHHVKQAPEHLLAQLKQLKGVFAVKMIPEDHLVRLKIDKNLFDEQAIDSILS